MSGHVRTTRAPEFPRGALYAAAALIALSMTLAAYSRITGNKMDWVPDASATSTRDVTFRTLDTGVIEIADAKAGTVLGVFPQETNAFVRIVAQGLAFERERLGGEASVPYRISRWSDGRVTVADPTSGRSVELGAFGQNQVKTFAALLPAAPTR